MAIAFWKQNLCEPRLCGEYPFTANPKDIDFISPTRLTKFERRFPGPTPRSQRRTYLTPSAVATTRANALWNIFAQRILARLVERGFLEIAICPSAERNQLISTLAALGCGAFVHQGQHRTAGFETTPSSKRVGVETSTGKPWFFASRPSVRFGTSV